MSAEMDEDYELDEFGGSPERFVGGVDDISADEVIQTFEEVVNDIPIVIQPDTLSTAGMMTAKRRGRPPKPEHEKAIKGKSDTADRMLPKNAIRISLTPNRKPRGRPPGSGTMRGVSHLEVSNSPFPLVQLDSSMKKPRGRPRIHPPKPTSTEKKPRGRPRTTPIEGEKGWRMECSRLRSIIKKKDALIDRMKQKLRELGVSLEELTPPEPIMIPGMEAEMANGSYGYNGVEMPDSDANTSHEVIVGQSTIEETHQTYIDLFSRDQYEEDDDDNDDNDDNDASGEDGST